MPDEALGVIAGGGALPRMLLADCTKRGRRCFAVGFRNHTDPSALSGADHMWARLGATGATIRRLKRENVREVVMVGNLRRPSPRRVAAPICTRSGSSPG